MAADQLKSVGDLLRRGQQAHERLWVETVGPALTSVQYGLLLTIGRNPSSSQQQISDEMSIDKSTVGDVLHRLAAKGLVEMARDSADRRRHVILLTPQGRSAVVTTSQAAGRVSDRFLEGMPFLDGETLVRLLRVIAYQGAPPDPDILPPPFEGWPLRLPVLRLDTTFGHLVRRAQRVYGSRWREMAGQDVTPVQFDAMIALADLGVADQGDWAERSSLDPATATSLLTRLTRRDLVEHTSHQADRRRKQLRLTAHGEQVLDKARTDACAVEEKILRPLSLAERETFTDLFRQVCLTWRR